MTSVAEGLSYESPRNTVELRDRHLTQRVFLAAADGLSWDVIQQLQHPAAGPQAVDTRSAAEYFPEKVFPHRTA
jgi:hypothetical protein